MDKKGSHSTYWGHIREGVSSLMIGLRLSWKHIWEARKRRTPIGVADEKYFEQEAGIVTLQYPFESIPVPDHGRYRLHNEIEDCIVCDKCAKVCPVNCIEIEPIRATEEIGKTSDGSSKRLYAAKFDIDMGKCCFCGLCTTVCPTECLTMTKVYDFSEFDVADHNYSFSEMTPLEILAKKKELEDYNQQKEKAKKEAQENAAATEKPAANPARPKVTVKPKAAYRPKVKPVVKKEPEDPQEAARKIMEDKKKADPAKKKDDTSNEQA